MAVDAEVYTLHFPEDTYTEGDVVEPTARVWLTGFTDESREFFVGFSVRDPDGEWRDNDGTTGSYVEVDPGNTVPVQLEWDVESRAPLGAYDARSILWTDNPDFGGDRIHTLDKPGAFELVEAEEYGLSIGTAGGGTVGVDPPGLSTSGTTEPYEEGTEVELTAQPDFGSQFDEWDGDVPYGARAEESVTVTMDEDKQVTAVFEEETAEYDLTVEAEGPGAVAVDPPGYSSSGTTEPYEEGTEVKLTAEPDSGARFDEWSGDVPYGAREDESVTLTVDGDKDVTAAFQPEDTSGGIDSVSIKSIRADAAGSTLGEDDVVTVTATLDTANVTDSVSFNARCDLTGPDGATVASDDSLAYVEDEPSIELSFDFTITAEYPDGNYAATIELTDQGGTGERFDTETLSDAFTVGQGSDVPVDYTVEVIDLETKRAVRNASVELDGRDSDTSVSDSFVDGATTFDGIPAGRYQLTIDAPDRNQEHTSEVIVSPEATRREVALLPSLPPEGIVLDLDDEFPVPNAEISIPDEGLRTTAGRNGAFAFDERLPSGTYEFEITGPEGNTSTESIDLGPDWYLSIATETDLEMGTGGDDTELATDDEGSGVSILYRQTTVQDWIYSQLHPASARGLIGGGWDAIVDMLGGVKALILALKELPNLPGWIKSYVESFEAPEVDISAAVAALVGALKGIPDALHDRQDEENPYEFGEKTGEYIAYMRGWYAGYALVSWFGGGAIVKGASKGAKIAQSTSALKRGQSAAASAMKSISSARPTTGQVPGVPARYFKPKSELGDDGSGDTPAVEAGRLLTPDLERLTAYEATRILEALARFHRFARGAVDDSDLVDIIWDDDLDDIEIPIKGDTSGGAKGDFAEALFVMNKFIDATDHELPTVKTSNIMTKWDPAAVSKASEEYFLIVNAKIGRETDIILGKVPEGSVRPKVNQIWEIKGSAGGYTDAMGQLRERVARIKDAKDEGHGLGFEVGNTNLPLRAFYDDGEFRLDKDTIDGDDVGLKIGGPRDAVGSYDAVVGITGDAIDEMIRHMVRESEGIKHLVFEEGADP